MITYLRLVVFLEWLLFILSFICNNEINYVILPQAIFWTLILNIFKNNNN